MRKTLPIVAVALSALLLAGCSGADADSQDAKCEGVASGSTSDSVKVTGKAGEKPKVTFSKPLSAKTTERTFITTGKGEKATESRTAEVAIVAFNGRTGDEVTSNGFDEGSVKIPLTVGDSAMIPALTQLVECAQAGSRVVLTAPVKDAFGPADPSQLGFKDGDTIVFVSDIASVLPVKATGKPQKAPEGFPTVKLAKDGTPSVTMPDSQPPAETEVGVLKKGAGATVKAGDSVTVQYQGLIWKSGEIFDQSWGRGPTTFPTTGVIPGFSKALVDQTVGSQVIVVIPPKDGYSVENGGDQPDGGNKAAGIERDDTLVFVIDILAVAE